MDRWFLPVSALEFCFFNDGGLAGVSDDSVFFPILTSCNKGEDMSNSNTWKLNDSIRIPHGEISLCMGRCRTR